MKIIILSFICLFSSITYARPNLAYNCPGKDIARKVHPLFKAYSSSKLCRSSFSKYDSFVHPTYDFKQNKKRFFLKQRIEGAVSQFNYLAPKGTNSLEVFRNMRLALQKADFEILSSSTPIQNTIKLGSDSSRFFKAFYPDLVRNGCFVVYHNTKKSPFYLSATKTLENGKSAFINFYARGPSKAHDDCDNRAPYIISVVESASLKTGQMSIDAKAIGNAFDLKGKIALYGVKFDYNSSSIKPESNTALKEISTFLKNRPSLNIYVVGHTDNKGSAKYNMSLSLRRAQSVVKYLVSVHKISQQRLSPHGTGPFAPVGTNQSDQGRSLNRRVELVEN